MRTVTEYLKARPEDRLADLIGKRNAVNPALYHRGPTQNGIKLGAQGTIWRVPKDLIVPKKDLTGGAERGILIGVDKNSIHSPIEQGRTDGVGEPWAIRRHGKPLNDRQQAILDKLPEYDSRVIIDKGDVSMTDLAALTAKTGDEFAMFTQGSRRLIVRGDFEHVNIDKSMAAEMNAQGFKWSGHTHTKGVVPSEGDKIILRQFRQNLSSVYDSEGDFNFFGKS
ncbi:MAG: hypothetical protein LBC59_07950 [Chitinispirillales bacterium]|jgi:hypothetical protein|nr:hypothetical protein [Chitinispirillales bacterium]